MALRILTGMLFINGGPKNGRAIITHSPFRLSSAPSTVSLRKARVIGADGTFASTPAAMVSARQFAIIDVSPDTDYRLRINDTVTTTALTISWAGTGPIFNEEIPFIVVGEVGERFAVSGMPPTGSPRPRRPSRKARRPKKARRARKARPARRPKSARAARTAKRPKRARRPQRSRRPQRARRATRPRPRKASRAHRSPTRRRPARRPATRRRRR
jgi:hypothetical protein